jgi:hypothetical protein
MDLDEKILSVNRSVVRVAEAETAPPSASVAGERRRAGRARVPEPCPAQLQMRDATLVNISRFGVLVEHANPAWPGQVYHLAFAVQGTPLRLLARAVHAFASNRRAAPGGEGEIVFRTGLEFLAVEKETADVISAYVDGLPREEAAHR